MSNRYTRRAGVTLIELIVALVIMGVALAGMVAVYTATTRASVDPVIVQQMQGGRAVSFAGSGSGYSGWKRSIPIGFAASL